VPHGPRSVASASALMVEHTQKASIHRAKPGPTWPWHVIQALLTSPSKEAKKLPIGLEPSRAMHDGGVTDATENVCPAYFLDIDRRDVQAG